MATTSLYIELEAVKSAYGNDYIEGVSVKRILRKAPREVSLHTRWVMVCLDIEDPATLFGEAQVVGAFGVVPPIIDATLEGED